MEERKKRKPGRLSKAVSRIVLTLVGLIVGWWIVVSISNFIDINPDIQNYVNLAGAVLMGIVGFFTAYPLILGLFGIYNLVENSLSKFSAKEILMGMIGLLFGLLITLAIYILIYRSYISEGSIQLIVTIVTGLVLCFFGILVGANLMAPIIPSPATNVTKGSPLSNSTAIYILDSSSLIDGRILDIVRTGFINGRIIVPNFMLSEVTAIADSQDMLKKNRGRRGLDILAELQKEKGVKVDILETETQGEDTDTKLMKLAEMLRAPIISVDFNLNKLAIVKSVNILNINELANAIKPITLPGEKLTVNIVKEGKEKGQGVAFMEDGTMIVVENGSPYVGKTIEVTITTALQTSAGRMIFARVGM